MSADARYVAFVSLAELVPGYEYTRGASNAYRYDRQTGEVELVTVGVEGADAGNGLTYDIAISADGNRVAFGSNSSNLHPLSGEDSSGVFVRDMLNGVTHLASTNLEGGSSPGSNPILSANGNVVVFYSKAQDLSLLDDNHDPSGYNAGFNGDLFAYNLTTKRLDLVTVNVDGTGSGNRSPGSAALSADGSIVAFVSAASNLHPLDMPSRYDVFARNLVTETTHLVSYEDGEEPAARLTSGTTIAMSRNGDTVAFQDDHIYHPRILVRSLLTGDTSPAPVSTPVATVIGESPSISADGNILAFQAPPETQGLTPYLYVKGDVFAMDLSTGQTHVVSGNYAGTRGGNGGASAPQISADGSTVLFRSSSDNLLRERVAPYPHKLYSRNLITGDLQRVVLNADGTPSTGGETFQTLVSADGSVVAFGSDAGGLVEGDFNTAADVFIRDMSEATTELASKHPEGYYSNTAIGASESPVFSADGRYVAFLSDAVNLVDEFDLQASPQGSNRIDNVYWKDLHTGRTELVSINTDGTGGGNADSFMHTISADGSVVAFVSSSNNLHPLDTARPGRSYSSSGRDVFARDMISGTTHLVSINSEGTGGGTKPSFLPALSADGTIIAFASSAGNLHPLDTDLWGDVFVRDLIEGTTTLVSVNAEGTESGNGWSTNPSISLDGTHVAFDSGATDLDPLDSGSNRDVFVRNLISETTVLASVNLDGTAQGNGISSAPVISGDGTGVAFFSTSTDLHPLSNLENVSNGVFVRDLVADSTFSVANDSDSSALSISSDGTRVLYKSRSEDLYVGDVTTGTAELVNVSLSGGLSNGDVRTASMSADGTLVAFASEATDLHPEDASVNVDVFLRNLSSGTTYLISQEQISAPDPVFPWSYAPSISADGRIVGFTSYRDTFVPGLLRPQPHDVFYVGPPAAENDHAETSEDSEVTIDVLANDIDLTDEDLSVVGFAEPANGTVVANPDGTITYTPNVDYSGVDSFEYTVSDPGGLTAVGLVTVKVLSASEQVEQLQDSIRLLQEDGTLYEVHARDLMIRLRQVSDKIVEGELEIALVLLDAFEGYLRALTAGGVLPAEPSQELNAASESLRTSITTQAPMPDFDGDGDVDLSDLLSLQRGYGVSAPDASMADGDGDGDGDVDAHDQAMWSAAFGQVATLQVTSVQGPQELIQDGLVNALTPRQSLVSTETAIVDEVFQEAGWYSPQRAGATVNAARTDPATVSESAARKADRSGDEEPVDVDELELALLGPLL